MFSDLHLSFHRPLTAIICAVGFATLSGCMLPEQIALNEATAAPKYSCAPAQMDAADEIKNLTGGSVASATVDAFLASRMEALNIPGVSIAIINDQKIVYHRTLGVTNASTGAPVNACSIFQGASITKPLFGYFVMTFVDEGKLDLDRPLHEYLPYPDIAHDDRYQAITARMVLSHQTGLPNWRDDYEDKQLFIQFEPGSGFSYSGEAYQYLSLVLQKIAGVDHAGLEALFQARVAKPLGLTQTQVIPSDVLLQRRVDPHRDGEPILVRETNSYREFGAAYGVHSHAADFSKWLIALMKEEGLSKSAFDSFYTPQNVAMPKVDNLLILSHDYALGFAVFDTPFGRIYGHDGNNPGFSSGIALEKSQGWGIVAFANADQTSELALELLVFLNMPEPH